MDLLVEYDDSKKKLSLYDVLRYKVGLEEILKISVDIIEDGFVFPPIIKYIENEKILLINN